MVKPMADGGEGTIEAILSSDSGKEVFLTCQGPLNEPIQTFYGLTDEKVAIIESAKMIGLPQVPLPKRNPNLTTSYGLGEAILHALDHGCAELIIGLGGSATNDSGFGMLQALGMKAY